MELRGRAERASAAVAIPTRTPQVAHHARRAGLLFAVAIATYILFPAAPAVDIPIFEVGSVATDNVIAPYAFAVPKPGDVLARERDEAARSVRPIFVYAPAALDSSLRALDHFTELVHGAAAARQGRAGVASIVRAGAAAGVTLSIAEAEYLATPVRRAGIVDAVRRALERWLPGGVVPTSAAEELRGDITIRRGPDARDAAAESALTFAALLGRARALAPTPHSATSDALFVKLVTVFFHPSLVPDRAATDRRRQDQRSAVDVDRFQVRTGEKIVGAHEVVGREEHEKLRALRAAVQDRAISTGSAGRVMGATLYNALVLLIFGVTVLLFRPQLYKAFRSMALFAMLFVLVLLGAALASRVQPDHMAELVPIALAAVMCSVLFDPRISMIAAMILAVLIGGQGVFRGTNALFINMIVGSAAAISVRVIRRRDQSYYSIIVIALSYMLAALAVGLTLEWEWREIWHSGLWGGANALGSVALAMILIPLAERFTRITTDLTLLEYSDLNRPLLQRLMLEAPGTHAHTMRVANLVEAACNAIGANGLLGRVGTYYHDIGKLKKPLYFVENQPRGRNPHDALKPVMSATIIRNHVREGLELAAQSHLPPAITSFIPEHHGTGSISYFLEKARERGDAEPSAAEFQYPGPIPQTAETAILMLADGVEAATHVLNDPAPERIREVIERIVRLRIEQGQLRDAPITLKQIDQIKEQFARVLIGMHHNRIDYPAASGGVTSEFAAV
ncbi:MAG: HDIG domain-containing metalloprotein [Gemmatimonadaceae bacterium]